MSRLGRPRLFVVFVVALLAAWGCTRTQQVSGGEPERRPKHLFDPKNVPSLEDPKRDQWQKPEEILDALKLQPGQVVADIGAGSGYFTFRMARRVGPTGRVYAEDIQRPLVELIQKRAAERGVQNIVPILGEVGDVKLAPGAVDLALLVDMYHEVEKPQAFLRSLHRALKPDGRLAVIDFGGRSPVGPPPDHLVAEPVLIRELEQAGFVLAERHTFLPYQYFLVFRKR